MRGALVTRDDFKLITKESLEFNEEGRNMMHRAVSFYKEKKSERAKSAPFDIVIREQVFKTLKY